MSLTETFAKRAGSISMILLITLVAGTTLVSCSPAESTEIPGPTKEETEQPAKESTDAAPSAEESIVYDFEDGTEQGWGPRGEDVTVSITTDIAHSGSNSLLVNERSEDWHGAIIDVLDVLEPDTIYEMSVFVKLAEGEPESQVILTMQRTPIGDDTQYEWIAPSSKDGVTDADWVQLKGQYSFSGEVSELGLYIESPDEELVDFYIDDITITKMASSDVETREYDFEDGSTQGWKARGDAKVSVSTDAAHSGSSSLLVTDRAENWNGVSIDVTDLLQPDTTYDMSAFVMLAEGEPESKAILTMQRTPVDGDTQYEWIAPSDDDGVTDADWIELKGQYSYTGEVSELLLYIESPDEELVDFYIDDVSISRMAKPKPAVQTSIPSLYETLSDYFPVGAALEPEQLDSKEHVELLTQHFNSITAENAMKPGPIQATEGEFRWSGSDRLVAFAKENDMAVHGHTLVWHSQAAEWMFEDEDGNPLEATEKNKELVLQRLEDHIREIVGRYKDDVNVWDVVNEVIDPAEEDCMRRSSWYELTGTDYIVTAFNVANEVAPDATLIINDYSLTQQDKRTCMCNVVEDLLAQGVPVEGIGMQMHVNIENPSVEAIEQSIESFASLGVEVHITELDMSIYTDDSSSYTMVPEEIMTLQGHRYKDIFAVLKRHADSIGSVTFWGMADDHTWLKTWPTTRINLPLLFDEQLQAKPAYWGIIDPSKLPLVIHQTNAIEGTPTIDGVQEDVWDLQTWTSLQMSETLSASYKALWDDANLYLLVDVKDATADPEDMLEIFIDQNNGRTTSYEDDDLHYVCRDNSCTPNDTIEHSLQATVEGYQLEAAITLIEKPYMDRRLGFDIRVTDSNQPDAPIMWNDLTNVQDENTAYFGTLVLAEAVQITMAVQGVPEIDAEEDAIWAAANEISTDVWVMGSSGATAKVKTLWNSQYLYVYAVVTDTLLSKESSNAWEQDSIEVFLDQNNEKTTSYQSDDAQYRVNFDNEQSFNGAATADLISSATKIIPGGYVVELAIKLDAVQLSDGVRIGFDFQVNNDEDGDGVRDSVAIWEDPTGQSYQNTSKIGILEFSAQ